MSRWARNVRTLFFIAAGQSPGQIAAAGQTAAAAAGPGRDDHGRKPAHRDDGRPAALAHRLHDRADRDERHGEYCDQIEPPCPWPHGEPPFLSSVLVIDKLA